MASDGREQIGSGFCFWQYFIYLCVAVPVGGVRVAAARAGAPPRRGRGSRAEIQIDKKSK